MKGNQLLMHVISVRKVFQRNVAWTYMLPQCMKEKKSFQCLHCNGAFSQKGNLEKHISNVHECKRQFKCEDCELTYKRKEHLFVHFSSVHEGKKYSCLICNNSFKHKTYLKKHNVLAHGEKKPYQCNNCKSFFSRKSDLKAHVKVIHNNK